MARSKVDQVIEHRVTLGKFERTELKQSLDLIQKRQQNELYKQYAVGAALGGSAIAVGYGVYKAVGMATGVADLFAGVWATINGIGVEDITDFVKKGSCGTVSPWKKTADQLNPLVRQDEFDIRYMTDAEFTERYLMSKGEYLQNYVQAGGYGMIYKERPNPDNYCNGYFNCGIPDQQSHYANCGSGFGL